VTLTRKEFFRKGLFSLGESLLKVGSAVRETQNLYEAPPAADEPDREPVPNADSVACADNQHCLARNCGCFSCVERCEAQAIMVIPGAGIRIDESLCTGCGTCEYVCPVTPKAVRMIPRKVEQDTE